MARCTFQVRGQRNNGVEVARMKIKVRSAVGEPAREYVGNTDRGVDPLLSGAMLPVDAAIGLKERIRTISRHIPEDGTDPKPGGGGRGIRS